MTSTTAMAGPVSASFPSAFLDRCYECCNPTPIAPFATQETPATVRAVYRCGCGHVWYVTYDTAAYGIELRVAS